MTDAAVMMRRRRLTMLSASSCSSEPLAEIATDPEPAADLMQQRRQQMIVHAPKPTLHLTTRTVPHVPRGPLPLQRHSDFTQRRRLEKAITVGPAAHETTARSRVTAQPHAVLSRPAMQRQRHRAAPPAAAQQDAIASHSKRRETAPGDVQWIARDPFMIAYPDHCRAVQSVYFGRKTPKSRRKEGTLVQGPRGYEHFMENKGFDPYPASLAAVVSWQTSIVGPKRPGHVTHGSAGRYLGAVINVHLEKK
jgi:hypothetical protein